jgi:putative endonuclease
MDENYFVYVLLCADGTFYTGITNNLAKRIETHNSGKGAKYVKSRLPVKLIYSEIQSSKSNALKRELEIKSWSRAMKIAKLNLITFVQ